MSNQDAIEPAQGLRLTTPPVPQNPTADGITISWGVSCRSTGWVEYGLSPDDLSERAVPSRHGLVAVDEHFLAVCLENLRPGERVHYRTMSVPVTYHTAYDIRRGDPVASAVGSFTLPGRGAQRARLACINDTHAHAPTTARLVEALGAAPMDLVVWNGDVFGDLYSAEQIADSTRLLGDALRAPLLFLPGNHELRGPAARLLPGLFAPWQSEEPLGRCFTVRHGPLGIIALDTGEDKPDWRREWAGLAAFEPYRRQQQNWLERALCRPDIADAPHLVVFCHIPLHGLPGQNGGDTGGTSEDYARFCRQCQELWGPLLDRAGVQLVISGHTHVHRYDAPEPGRCWGQLVGGGPTPQTATIIRADATPDALQVTAEDLQGRSLGRWQFAPRPS